MAVALATLMADDDGMKNAIWIWIVRVVSLCVLGPAAGGLMNSLRASDGSVHATGLLGASMVGGGGALVGVFVLAMIGGVLATKMVSLREGVFNVGLVIAWGAWGGGQVGEALRGAPESGSFLILALEGAIVLGLMMGVLSLLAWVSRGNGDERDGCVRLDCDFVAGFKSNVLANLGLMGIGLGVSMALVWLQVQNDLSGQAVWGGFIGAVGAGVAGGMMLKSVNMARENVRGHREVLLVPVMIGVGLGGVVGPILSMVWMPGGGNILQAIASGGAPGWMMMSALAWCGGAMIGTPMGYSWVESSVARQQGQAVAG